MSRTLHASDEGVQVKYYTVSKGGTGGTNQATARTSLKLANKALIGLASGPIELDHNKKIVLSDSDLLSLYKPTVDGPTEVVVQSVSTFKITNYDSKMGYTISAVNGSVSLIGDTLTYLAPIITGTHGFKINGYTYPVSVVTTLTTVDTVVAGPSSLLVNTFGTYTISNYDSSKTYTVKGVLGSVSVSGNTVTFLATNISGMGGFTINGTMIYVAIVDAIINTPSITTPVNYSTVVVDNYTVKSTNFSLASGTGTHVSTDWELSTDVDFTTLLDSSYENTTNKTTWTPSGTVIGSAYYVRVRYRDSNDDVSAWSSPSLFSVIKAS